MPEVSLEHCPACGRPLGDRPPPNQCPDCGFAYDERTRVWRSNESWARLVVVYATVGLFIGIAIAVLYRLGYEQVPNPTLALVCFLAAPLVGLAFRRVLSGRITGRFVALTPGGIVVGTRATPRTIPWHDFDRLSLRRNTPRIVQRSTGDLMPLEDIFASAAEVAAFRDALRRGARNYQA